MQYDCKKCLLSQASKMTQKLSINGTAAQEVTERFEAFLNKYANNGLLAPEASRYLNQLLKGVVKTDDLYEKEKESYNSLMLNLENEIWGTIQKSPDPFQTALRYALAGNIIDFGPPGSFDIYKTLSEATSKIPAIDNSEILFNELQKASTVLYLGDNAGEIVLDKLFIKTIKHPNLYFATRGGKVINDVTLEDAENIGMPAFAKVISNGYDAPSTLLPHCSNEFKNLFDEADIIISKGQGNLEGLIANRSKKIFFLLMIKCDIIGNVVGVKTGESVALYNQLIQN